MQTATADVTDIDNRKRKPKPTKNPDAGEVGCAFCTKPAPVRKNAHGKLYYNCAYCGIVQPALPFFQEWILQNATLYGPEGKPEPDPRAETKTEKNGDAEVAGRVEIVPPAPAPAPVPAVPAAEIKKSRGLRFFK